MGRAAAASLTAGCALAVAFGLVGLTYWLQALQNSPTDYRAAPTERESSPTAWTGFPRQVSAGSGQSQLRCRPSSGTFVPSMVLLPRFRMSASALALKRDLQNVPGVPPISIAGKQAFAWDLYGAKPGSAQGNVKLNAHTWSDGSALGNALLRRLEVGDLMVVRGSEGERVCYRVREKVQVAIAAIPPGVLARFYSTSGPPELTVLVCSGTRLGPGRWTHRTLWFAKPVQGAKTRTSPR